MLAFDPVQHARPDVGLQHPVSEAADLFVVMVFQHVVESPLERRGVFLELLVFEVERVEAKVVFGRLFRELESLLEVDRLERDHFVLARVRVTTGVHLDDEVQLVCLVVKHDLEERPLRQKQSVDLILDYQESFEETCQLQLWVFQALVEKHGQPVAHVDAGQDVLVEE